MRQEAARPSIGAAAILVPFFAVWFIVWMLIAATFEAPGFWFGWIASNVITTLLFFAGAAWVLSWRK